jgi:hypothetical protein
MRAACQTTGFAEGTGAMNLDGQRKALVRRFWAKWCVIGYIVFFAIVSAEAQPREYQIKAAFLVNFVQFVTWPSNAFADADAPLRIAVLGADPFGGALDRAVRSAPPGPHKIVVTHCDKVADCKNCQMIFIARSEDKNQAAVLSQLDSQPILTVSESTGFAKRGGVINFFVENNKVRFEINPSAAQRDKLKISSQLLNLGKLVDVAGGSTGI